ncbi:albusnodin family lasso peptide [Streptomyces sp. NPDC056488]
MNEIIKVSDPDENEEIVTLGDAAVLTKGSTNSSVENKRSPYDA